MRKLKILVISFAFPPMSAPQSIQVPRFVLNLDASVVVVCGDNPHDVKDETILPGVERSFEHIIRVPFYRHNLMRYLDKLGSRLHCKWYELPDIQRNWVKQADKHFFEWQKISGFEPDLILTFGMPMSDHLFGMKYKKRTGIPWVAHFSDPWSDNMCFDDQPLIGWLNKRIERQVIAEADVIIFTSQETIDLVMKKYPVSWRDKAFYVPHSYDKMAFDNSLIPDDKCYVIRYLGSFYHPRSPKSFFEAVEAIAKTKPDLLNGVVIEFIGHMGIFKSLLSNYPYAQQFIRIVKTVSYADSLRLMQTAHCLLVIDAPADLSVFFPSKLVEYIGANRFIFAISPHGATNRIVEEVGGMIADPLNIDAIINALENILMMRPKAFPSSNNRYEKKMVGEEIIKIINTIIPKR